MIGMNDLNIYRYDIGVATYLRHQQSKIDHLKSQSFLSKAPAILCNNCVHCGRDTTDFSDVASFPKSTICHAHNSVVPDLIVSNIVGSAIEDLLVCARC